MFLDEKISQQISTEQLQIQQISTEQLQIIWFVLPGWSDCELIIQTAVYIFLKIIPHPFF